ncbi:hypothetical protein L1887_31716 [Cichorium endivia]|nr:hypothetical protein L1887_31716 [Cichorium endivia]
MSGVQDSLEIRFRLIDGSDIGPKSFPAAASVSTLKESILSQWPKEKENAPKTVKDLKIINAGKILENNRTVGECRSPLCDVPGGVTTMHVVVSQPPQEKEKKYNRITSTFADKECWSLEKDDDTINEWFGLKFYKENRKKRGKIGEKIYICIYKVCFFGFLFCIFC